MFRHMAWLLCALSLGAGAYEGPKMIAYPIENVSLSLPKD